jgi:hypothetical protein
MSWSKQMVEVNVPGLSQILERTSVPPESAGRRLLYLLAAAISSLALISCSTTWSDSMTNAFKPKPTTTLMLIESNPAGATAKASTGQSCKTPCTILISQGSDFTVTFTLDGHVPQTLPVHATMNPGGWNEAASPVLDPGSLFPTLQPVNPGTATRRAKTASQPAATQQ